MFQIVGMRALAESWHTLEGERRAACRGRRFSFAPPNDLADYEDARVHRRHEHC